MREIKFNFIYGVDGDKATYFNKTFTFGEIEGGSHFDEISDSPLLKDHSILAKRQFTGLKDRNGVEIYEGDILRSNGCLVVVFYQAPSFVMKEKLRCRYSKVWTAFALSPDQNQFPEIIGNTYENPELLDAN